MIHVLLSTQLIIVAIFMHYYQFHADSTVLQYYSITVLHALFTLCSLMYICPVPLTSMSSHVNIAIISL